MKNVLIVEDDEIDSIILSRVLKSIDSEIRFEIKKDGSSALHYLKGLTDLSNWPSIIFVDINMPGINGFQFVEGYKKISPESNPKTELFILSSSESPADKKRASNDSHIEDYITKPMTREIASKILNR